MLPGKRRNRSNERGGETPACHKSRKLNKLKEEKLNSLLLSKSVEALEKYTIPEGARALLQSSRNIGQVESRKKKPSKWKSTSHESETDHVSSDSEPESEITLSTMLLCGTRPPVSPFKINISNTSFPEDVTSSMDHNSESINSMDKVQQSSKLSYSSKLPALSILKDPKNRRLVSRPPDVVKARSDIPIVMMEQEIMEAINESSIVIISGETGCGKTTQVPQFLCEVGVGSSGCPLGSGIVGVTQPRRIAVYGTASRVAYKLGVRVGAEVGYQVRYDKKLSKSCSINFMTAGILL